MTEEKRYISFSVLFQSPDQTIPENPAPCGAGITSTTGTYRSALLSFFKVIMVTHTNNEEDEEQIEECEICGGDIIIDSFCEEDDIVYCNDCEAEYLIHTLDPVRLTLLEDEEDEEDDDEDDSYDDEDD